MGIRRLTNGSGQERLKRCRLSSSLQNTNATAGAKVAAALSSRLMIRGASTGSLGKIDGYSYVSSKLMHVVSCVFIIYFNVMGYSYGYFLLSPSDRFIHKYT